MKRPIAMMLLFSAALSFAAPARAQQPRPERPYRGVFGGGVGETEQLLTASASGGAGYDDDVLASGSPTLPGVGSAPPRPGIGSVFTSLSGGLNYSLSRDRVSFNVSGSGAGHRYFDLADSLVLTGGGSAGGVFEIGSRTQLSANVTVSYQPLNYFGLFPTVFEQVPGEAPPLDLNYAAVDQSYLSTAGSVSLNQTLSRRTTAYFGYYQSRSNFSSVEGLDFTSRSVSGGLSHGIAKGLNLRLGYGYSLGGYGGPDDENPDYPSGHTIDAGVDFQRALSISRRTTLAFTTGSSAWSQFDHTRFDVVGSASLAHEIGRSWTAALAYNRGAQFVDSIRQPVFSDGLSLSLNGLISRKLQFRSSAGGAFGQVGIADDSGDYHSLYATSGVTYALSRNLGLALDYSYYHYTFDRGLAFPIELRSETDRQSLRASVDLWATLVHRARRPNATR